MMMYLNFQIAFLRELQQMLLNGEEVTVRGSTTKEQLMHSFSVLRPYERISIIKGRNNNIFAQIAETLWMLAGRDDLDFLEKYIPSVRKWSDDGKTWRGAYGPRLRKWRGHAMGHGFLMDDYIPQETWQTDQFEMVARKINGDKFTRQAIMTLWDPANDWVPASKDYPCNNWLHFIQRNGKLHLNVAVRSNDIMFGFSHVDFFGWSVLLQAMAFWTQLDIGAITWNATSFHLYERHWDKAQEIALVNVPASVYDFDYDTPVWDTPFSLMDEALKHVFTIDTNAQYSSYDSVGNHMEQLLLLTNTQDFIFISSIMLALYNTYLNKDLDEACEYLNIIPYNTDLRAAAIEFFLRKWPPLILEYMYDELTTRDVEFINHLRSL